MKFPDTVGGPECPSFIRFTPEKVDYSGKSGLNNNGRSSNPANSIARSAADSLGLAGTASTVVDRAGAAVGGAVDGIISDAVGAVQGAITDALGDFGGLINVGGIGQITGAASGTINLFMPDGVKASQSVTYAEGGGISTMAAASAMQAGQKEGSLADAFDAYGQHSSLIAKELGEKFLNAMTDNSFAEARAAATGRVANNFSFMFFRSVDHRNFQYTFECVPINAGEAATIKAIVDTFIKYMLPKREGGDYIIPPQWKIEYVGANLIQPTKCFLRNVDVSYNDGAGRALHSDGHPVKTTISLDFVEIEPLFAE